MAPPGSLLHPRGIRGFSRLAQEDDLESGGDRGAEEGPMADLAGSLWQAKVLRPALERLRGRLGRWLSAGGPAVYQFLQVDDSCSDAEGQPLGRRSVQLRDDLQRMGCLDDSGAGVLTPSYTLLYAFSLLTFLVGLVGYLIPSINPVHHVVGALLFACGIFLLANSDLIVTCARLAIQVGRFRGNNKDFEDAVASQHAELRRLHKAQQGLKEIEARFGGNVQQAVHECGRLETVTRAQLAQCTRQLCKLYCDKNHDQMINAGTELSATLELFRTVYGILKDYPDREQRLLEGLRSKAVFRRDGGIKLRTFQELMECMLMENEIGRIPRLVGGVLDRAAGRGLSGGLRPAVAAAAGA